MKSIYSKFFSSEAENNDVDVFNNATKAGERALNEIEAVTNEVYNSMIKGNINSVLVNNYKIASNEYSKGSKKGFFNLPENKMYFSAKKVKELSEQVNSDNSNEQVNADKINAVDGGFNPIVQMFANKSNISFEAETDYVGQTFYAEKTADGSMVIKQKTTEISDILEAKNYNGNPFLPIIIGQESAKNIIANKSKLKNYYTEDVTSALGIKQEVLDYGHRNFIAGNTQRQALLLNRNLLREIGFEVCDAQEFVTAAVENVAKMMEANKVQELIYNQYFNSPKFLRAGAEHVRLLNLLFVDANNPKLWSEQTDDEFLTSMKNLEMICRNIKLYRFKLGQDKINIQMSINEVGRLERPFYLELSNGTGKITAGSFTGCKTRFECLFRAGVDVVNACIGLNKENDFYKLSDPVINREKYYIGVKSYHQFCNMLETGGIVGKDMVNGLTQGLKNDSNYIQTSPVDRSILCLSIHSPVFYPSFAAKTPVATQAMCFDI